MNTAEQQPQVITPQSMPAVQTNQTMPAVAFEDMAMSAEAVKRQVAVIQDIMKGVMKSGEHYGVIPGCGDKPALLKPGAEKLGITFRLAPDYTVDERQLESGHREYRVTCNLIHIPTGSNVGQGVGTCTTMESKFRFRKGEAKCPKCGRETIIKSKQGYGGGWLCYEKKGGCNARFKDGDPEIENQNMGRIEHDNPADYYNTCLKMGKKRAHVDAILTATGASDIFAQDIDDPDFSGGKSTQQPQRQGSTNAPRPASKKQVEYLSTLCSKAGFTEQAAVQAVRDFTGRQDIQDLWSLSGPECSALIKAAQDGALAAPPPPSFEDEMPEGY